MGVWGTGVFSSDEASEVRDQWRELVGNGHDGPSATDALIESFRELLADEDSCALFWIPMAVTQWRVGRLEERVKARALALIDNGTALRAWQEDPSLLAARRKVLTKTADILRSPQPKKRAIRKRFKNSCDWEAGELVSYRLLSGKYVVFRIVGTWTDNGGTSPVVEVIDWCGESIPELNVLARLPIRSNPSDAPEFLKPSCSPERSQFFIGEVSKRRVPVDRLSRLNMKLPPTQEVGGFTVWLWREIDGRLEREFGYT